ncbi:MAG: hypothetical protein OJF58_005086 [Enhydrobacter sp.]|nr:MAG: hypothetical protein OJF58_005086 [Enhydrobacter sp.]
MALLQQAQSQFAQIGRLRRDSAGIRLNSAMFETASASVE